ncbi:MAG: hypothetical protein K2G90_10040 [Muribaculaceae bacterium]|nr:hypothetical protein [Muribaculaceae bacterium]
MMTVLGLSLTILAGCSSQDMPDSPMADNKYESKKSEKILAIERYIDRTHKSSTRGAETPLLPYVVDGDTVMFVANYPDGGFEIFSNDLALPMVLVKSKTGSYNPYDKITKTPFDEYLADAAKTIAANKGEVVDSDINVTWKVFTKSSYIEDTRALQYVGQAAEVNFKEYTPKGGRLATKWTKESPYNQFTPFFTNGTEHSLVGCGGVAVGQYLFHSHTYFNVPVSTVTTATYNSSSNTYSFTGSSSSVWNSMVYKSTSLIDARQTAIFLGYIAKEMHTRFGQKSGDGSSTYAEDYPSVIYSQCGYTCRWTNFSTTTLHKILSGGHPAICISSVTAYEENGTKLNVGHAYLIDYANFTNVTYYDVYASKSGVSNGDEEEEEENNYAYGNSLDYYRKKYGEISTNYLYNVSEHWISMNWGWGEGNDNVLFNAELSTWSTYHDKYKNVEVYYTQLLESI